MYTPAALERMADRTPYTPEGFSYLKQPVSPIFFDMPGGRLHVFAGQDFQKYRSSLQEYAVQIDQAAFDIDYWTAMREVSFNMRKGVAISAAFFEPDESLRVNLQTTPSVKGEERVFSSALNRLAAPFANFLNPSAEPNIGWNLPFAGYATHELWRIATESGNLTIMYISTMAFLPELTGEGLGPMALRFIYNTVKPHMIAARVQNGAPISALAKSQVIEGPVFGVDEEPDSTMRNLSGFFEDRTLHPRGIDLDKLIARAVYKEGANRKYVYGRTQRGRASEATDKLIARGVDPQNGDGAYIAVWGRGKEAQWKGRQRLFIVPVLNASETEVN